MTTVGIGAPVRRREDHRLLTGRGRYTDDLDAPGQAYAAFVRSPLAHADVVAIDAAPARAVAGVLGMFTGRDLAADGVGPIPTLIAERGGGIRNRDGSPLAEPPGIRCRATACVTSASPSRSSSRRRRRRPRTARTPWRWSTRCGRPLKWTSSRTEGFLSDAQSRDHVLTGELALDAAGRLVALRVRSTQNLGAYVATGMPISIILNMVRTFPYRTATGALYDSGDYVARLDEALELADAAGFPGRREETARRGKLRGMGIGPYLEGTGGVPREYAEVRVLPDGTVEVPIGSQSQGQGHETVFAQVVAERLGVKGAGEGATVGAPDAVIHAILNALAPLGVTHLDMPATPARVWQAIRTARAAGCAGSA